MKKLIYFLGILFFDISLHAMSFTRSIPKLRVMGCLVGKNIRNQTTKSAYFGNDVCKILNYDIVIGILGGEHHFELLNDIRIQLIHLGFEEQFKTLPEHLAISMMMELQGKEKPGVVKVFLQKHKKDSECLEKLYWLWHKVDCVQATSII